MDLARDRSQLKCVELLIGRDEREIGVLRDTPRATLRRIERPGLGDDVLRAAPLPGLGIAIPAHDVALAIDDRAVGVHDREHGNAGRSDETRRPALPGELRGRAMARRGRAAGAVRALRKTARAQRARRGAAELLVRVDRVLTPAVVEDDRALHERDVHPLRRVPTLGEELGGHAGRRLEPVERTAGEADRVRDVQVLAVDPRRPAAHVDVQRGDLREVEHGAAGRALRVFGDADLEPREVHVEPALRVDLGDRRRMNGVVARLRHYAPSESRTARSVAMRTATDASISAVSIALVCARSVADASRITCEWPEIDSVLTGKPM